jgi:hypothetical protein
VSLAVTLSCEALSVENAQLAKRLARDALYCLTHVHCADELARHMSDSHLAGDLYAHVRFISCSKP